MPVARERPLTTHTVSTSGGRKSVYQVGAKKTKERKRVFWLGVVILCTHTHLHGLQTNLYLHIT